MRIPRDLSGEQLVRVLEKHGYELVRRSGNHVRLVHPGPPRHGITIPLHKALKVGTINAILTAVAGHLKIRKETIFTD